MNENELKEGVKYSIYEDNFKKTLKFYGDEISYEYDPKYAPKPDVLIDKGVRARIALDSAKQFDLTHPVFRTIFRLDQLEETLEFYANSNHYMHSDFLKTEVMQDNGQRARKIV